MATIEQEDELREKVHQKVQEITTTTVASLVRQEELGRELSFQPGERYFIRVIALFRELEALSLDTLPYQALNKLELASIAVLDQFRQITMFSASAPYPNGAAAQRDVLINAVRDNYDAWWNDISPIIAFATRKGFDFARIESAAKESVQALHRSLEEVQASAKTSQAEASEILSSLRAAAAESGVSQQAIYFKQEAEDQNHGAVIWLRTTVAMAVVTIAAAMWSVDLFATTVATLNASQALQFAISKLLALSVLFYLLFACGRNYRAARHNFIVNRHRQNALATFQAFVKAAGDDATRNAVLLKATEAVFGPDVSGYLAKESTDSTNFSQVVEVVKSLKD